MGESNSFMFYLLYAWGKCPQYPLNRVLGDRPRAGLEILEKRNISCYKWTTNSVI
jgi:hypothetical protein